MKKWGLSVIMSIILAMSLCSCSKEEPVVEAGFKKEQTVDSKKDEGKEIKSVDDKAPDTKGDGEPEENDSGDTAGKGETGDSDKKTKKVIQAQAIWILTDTLI